MRPWLGSSRRLRELVVELAVGGAVVEGVVVGMVGVGWEMGQRESRYTPGEECVG